jgi:hypothetical protein
MKAVICIPIAANCIRSAKRGGLLGLEIRFHLTEKNRHRSPISHPLKSSLPSYFLSQIYLKISLVFPTETTRRP